MDTRPGDIAGIIADTTNRVIEVVLGQPEIAEDGAWDTYALVATVEPSEVDLWAWRYTDDGPAIATEAPFDATQALWDLHAAVGGRVIDADRPHRYLVRIHRDQGRAALEFVPPDEFDLYDIADDEHNLDEVAELLRPGPEHFGEPA
jgi:hypothetical protein